jgi:hypothetical protein
VIWAFAQGDANNSSLDESLSFSDSAGGTWSTPVQDNARGGAVVAAAWRSIPATSPGSMTVTLTDNKGSVAKRLFVRVFTGTDLTNPQGASTAAGTASVSYTSTVANSWGWSVYLGSNATITAGANTTLQDSFGGFDSGDAVGTFSATTTTATPGTTVTLVESGGTAVHHVVVEIVPPSALVQTNYAGPWTGPTPGMLGPTGMWTLPRPLINTHTYGQALAGTVTPTGALSKQDNKAVAGTVTPTGAATKQDSKAVAGTATPSGALSKQDSKAIGGTVAPAGSLAKLAKKAFAGTVTPSGVLSTVKVILRSFAGTVTPSGAVTRTTNKGFAGAVTPTGSLAKSCRKAISGALTPVGNLAKTAAKGLAGLLGLAGALTNVKSGGAATARAASTSTVTANTTSAASVSANTTSAAAVTENTTSTSTVESD